MRVTPKSRMFRGSRPAAFVVFCAATFLTIFPCASIARADAGSRFLVHRPVAAETILYRFAGGNDGAQPQASLIIDRSGALYGTTQSGGSVGAGTVFTLRHAASGYTNVILANFLGGRDGAQPLGGLIADNAGALYGTTVAGGGCSVQSSGCGTIFKLTPTATGYTKTILYRFAGGTDGTGPTGTLIVDSAGDLFGTTSHGGTNAGYRTVFALVPTVTGYTERVLYRFAGEPDGVNPQDGDGLFRDASGALYGTTFAGGLKACSGGCGTVFKLTPHAGYYRESLIYRFHGKSDGWNPVASLIADGSGSLYGTAKSGGATACSCGVVFKLAPSAGGYVETVLYAFSGTGDGVAPTTRVVADAGGALYGTTALGGSCGIAPFYSCGNVYKLTPAGSGYTESILADFAGGIDGYSPEAGLSAGPSGTFYGTTAFGGGATACSEGCGTIFKLMP